jgi:hypothetical protein
MSKINKNIPKLKDGGSTNNAFTYTIGGLQ